MTMIGVRELREQTAEVLRRVREEQSEYVITYQGRPIAILLPVDTDAVETAILHANKKSVIGGWEVYTRLADDLRRNWPVGYDTQKLIDDIRQE